MNINTPQKEDLNKLLFSLKEEEIKFHRLKIVHLSKSIFLHPGQKVLLIKLKNSLRILDSLISA